MIKAIIFDLDNTLVDFMHMKKTSVKAAITAMVDAGLDMDKEDAYKEIMDIYKQEGIEDQEVLDKFLIKHLGRLDHKLLAIGVVAYRSARSITLKLYPHVSKTLVALAKEGIKLALITDAPVKQAWLRLVQVNLHNILDAVVTIEDSGELKPSPKPFLKALEMLQLTPEQALYIGDWPERDMVGAKNVGMTTVFARYGAAPMLDIPKEADYVIDDVQELLKIVNTTNGMNCKV